MNRAPVLLTLAAAAVTSLVGGPAVPVALAATAAPLVSVVAPFSAPLVSVVAPFSTPSTHWAVSGGKASIASVTSPSLDGNGAAQIRYDVSSGARVSIAPAGGGTPLPGVPRTLTVDVQGDGSWNVIYLDVRDATGESFHFRAGNLSFTGWSTLSVDLTSQPAARSGGDGDGVLDLPIDATAIIIDRNPGGLKSVSSIVVDHMTSTADSTSPLAATPARFTPSAGESTVLASLFPVDTRLSLALADGTGRTRHLVLAAAAGSESTVAWDGRDDGGTPMRGSIRARVTAASASATRTFDVPYLAGLTLRNEAPGPGSTVGVNSTLTTISTANVAVAERQATLMEDASVRWAREEFDWNQIEPSRGTFNWPKFDQAVAVLDAHGISVLGKLVYSARWASSAPAGTAASAIAYYPPRSNAEYAAYARAVVHRYKDRVHTWEVWNEENLVNFWRPAPNPKAYAALLKATYAAIKAEDPTATVVLGGLAAGPDQAFLRSIAANGAWSSFDVLAIHAYIKGRPDSGEIVRWMANAKAMVKAYGNKPIWITEFGWSTYTGSGARYLGVSETAQAQYLARSYLMAAAADMGPTFWFELMERSTSATSLVGNYGLVELGGRLKPAYAALKRVGQALDQTVAIGTADPNAATRRTASGLDSATGWKATPLGGGKARLATSTTRLQGAGSIALTYSFSTTSAGVELRRSVRLPGAPSTVGLWVRGDGSANPVYVKLRDATGEVFQGAVGTLGSGWQRMVLYGDGADINWKHSGGDGDGKLDAPVTLTSIFVFRAGIGRRSGTVLFDNLQVETGPRVRGVTLARADGTLQALWTVSGSPTAIVPVPGTVARRLDGSTATLLTVTGGRTSLVVGGLPTAIAMPPALDTAVLTPNGDGITDTTTLSWSPGDGGTASLDIVRTADGATTPLWSGTPTLAGISRLTWDGTLGGRAAGTGSYRLRITVTGPDGRRVSLGSDVVIR